MKLLISFFTEAEAMNHIECNGLDNVVVWHNIFSGKYDILCTEGVG